MSLKRFSNACGSVKRQLGDGGPVRWAWRYTIPGRYAIAKSFGLDAATREAGAH